MAVDILKAIEIKRNNKWERLYLVTPPKDSFKQRLKAWWYKLCNKPYYYKDPLTKLEEYNLYGFGRKLWSYLDDDNSEKWVHSGIPEDSPKEQKEIYKTWGCSHKYLTKKELKSWYHATVASEIGLLKQLGAEVTVTEFAQICKSVLETLTDKTEATEKLINLLSEHFHLDDGEGWDPYYDGEYDYDDYDIYDKFDDKFASLMTKNEFLHADIAMLDFIWDELLAAKKDIKDIRIIYIYNN